MNHSLVANLLKSRRKELDFPVKYVLEQLQNMGMTISDKTLYGWENGYRQPDADVFLLLCKIYDIDTLAGIDKLPPLEGKTPLFLDKSEEKLIGLYRALNEEGKERLLETADDMVQSKKYEESGAARMDTEKA